MGQTNPVQIIQIYLYKIHLIVIRHLRLGLPSIFFLLTSLPTAYMRKI
jgi:hypothetical protein